MAAVLEVDLPETEDVGRCRLPVLAGDSRVRAAHPDRAFLWSTAKETQIQRPFSFENNRASVKDIVPSSFFASDLWVWVSWTVLVLVAFFCCVSLLLEPLLRLPPDGGRLLYQRCYYVLRVSIPECTRTVAGTFHAKIQKLADLTLGESFVSGVKSSNAMGTQEKNRAQ